VKIGEVGLGFFLTFVFIYQSTQRCFPDERSLQGYACYQWRLYEFRFSRWFNSWTIFWTFTQSKNELNCRC